LGNSYEPPESNLIAISGSSQGVFKLNKTMNRNQAFPIIYRKLKEHNITMDSLSLIERLKSFEAKVGNIQDIHIEAIIKKLVSNNKGYKSK
jgi:hypothetical protein